MGDIVEHTKWVYCQSAGETNVRELNSDRLSRDFTLREFHCHCRPSLCTTTLVSQKLIGLLQALRDIAKEPILINDAFRCPAHDKAVNPAQTTGQHAQGTAADVTVGNTDTLPALVPVVISLQNLGGLGLYFKDGKLNRLHVDVRARGPQGLARWRVDQ